MKHYCSKMKNKTNVYIEAGTTQPWLVSVNSDGFERCVDGIRFCPYCGELLDNLLFEEEMRYFHTSTMEDASVIAAGRYFGISYFVCSLGNHPVCYIDVGKIPELRGASYDSNVIEKVCAHEPHGGFTWSDKFAPALKGLEDGAAHWFLGWDYAHCGDYSAYEESFPADFRWGGRKWETAEIIIEAKRVIAGIITEEEDAN